MQVSCKDHLSCVYLFNDVVLTFEGSGGCREAAVSGDAHGAGNHSSKDEAEHGRGQSQGAGGLKGQSASDH